MEEVKTNIHPSLIFNHEVLLWYYIKHIIQIY
jgi:hypothetical protein